MNVLNGNTTVTCIQHKLTCILIRIVFQFIEPLFTFIPLSAANLILSAKIHTQKGSNVCGHHSLDACVAKIATIFMIKLTRHATQNTMRFGRWGEGG